MPRGDNVWKGGRGREKPYKTCVARIPEGIKDMIQAMSSAYTQTFELTGMKEDDIPTLTEARSQAVNSACYLVNGLSNKSNQANSVIPIDEAIKLASDLRKETKISKSKLESLLSAIYGAEIKL